MRFARLLGLAMIGGLFLGMACGGGGGGSTSTPPAIQAPTGLTYSTNPAVYTNGVTITPNTPSSGGGAVVSYSVSPALPAGLTLNSSNGVINGIPTTVTAAANYIVRGSNASGSATAIVSIAVIAPPVGAPVITAQPISQVASVGQSITFNVIATGVAPLHYQWKKGTVIVGSDNSSYTIASVQNSDAGSYTVGVINIAGRADSNTVSLTVNPASLQVLWNSGPITSGPVYGSAFVDINSDGMNDLCITQFDSTNNVDSLIFYKGIDFSQLWRYSGNSGSYPQIILPQTGLNTSAPADFDGDGLKEILIAESGTNSMNLYLYNSVTHILKWKQTYAYTAPVGATAVYSAYSVQIGDIDGDGVFEIIITQNALYTPSGSSITVPDNWVKILK